MRHLVPVALIALAVLLPNAATAAGSPQTYAYPSGFGSSSFNRFPFYCAHDATCNGDTVVTHVQVHDLLDATGFGTVFVVFSGNSAFVCVRACDLPRIAAGVISLDPRDVPLTALLRGHLATEGTVTASFTD